MVLGQQVERVQSHPKQAPPRAQSAVHARRSRCTDRALWNFIITRRQIRFAVLVISDHALSRFSREQGRQVLFHNAPPPPPPAFHGTMGPGSFLCIALCNIPMSRIMCLLCDASMCLSPCTELHPSRPVMSPISIPSCNLCPWPDRSQPSPQRLWRHGIEPEASIVYCA